MYTTPDLIMLGFAMLVAGGLVGSFLTARTYDRETREAVRRLEKLNAKLRDQQRKRWQA